jgi:hypothetical protein
MKMKIRSLIVMSLALLLMLAMAYADENQQGEMQDMEVGAPEQMEDLAYLVGTWDVHMSWQDMEDTSKWEPSDAVCTYNYILDGCAIESDFTSDMMGKPFSGYMLLSYDRYNEQWQSLWIDTMGGKMSFYTGNMIDGKMVLTGEETWQGQKYLSRTVIYNETPTSFDWTMDNSYDGGETWQTVGKATYTKRE